MKCVAIAAVALAGLTEVAQAHYMFQYLTANGAKGAQYQNIRPVPNNSPVTVLSDPNLRCNVNGGTGGSTTTVSVAAGSTVSFTADQAVYHQGPVSFYMQKAASTAAASDGSGDWFKIKEIGPTFTNGQATWDMSATYSVTIPSQVAAGEYLLRIEQLGIHNPGSPPQFYISCAQVKVTGSGSGSPSPTTKIPGHVKSTDSGYTANIYNNFKSYVVPGPKVATF
ncbi:lytic polysaccharide monooxygenase [Plenodomus tracheiphilus IPT5]|uniref:AA9 family lytic polysaccharide monooxygenase n=1 Tax=Plenodomus tracheiphilus IPT5 TaxID=1408161 RepID=A0A6A7BIJ1_9PLEO|nr:lytic polysaccharide monooxygenase [Plenodomus tracheiphilus IPT5]